MFNRRISRGKYGRSGNVVGKWLSLCPLHLPVRTVRLKCATKLFARSVFSFLLLGWHRKIYRFTATEVILGVGVCSFAFAFITLSSRYWKWSETEVQPNNSNKNHFVRATICRISKPPNLLFSICVYHFVLRLLLSFFFSLLTGCAFQKVCVLYSS